MLRKAFKGIAKTTKVGVMVDAPKLAQRHR